MFRQKNMDARTEKARAFALSLGAYSATPRNLQENHFALLYAFNIQGRQAFEKKGFSPDYALLLGDISISVAARTQLLGEHGPKFYDEGNNHISVQHKGWLAVYAQEHNDFRALRIGEKEGKTPYALQLGNIMLPNDFLLEWLVQEATEKMGAPYAPKPDILEQARREVERAA